MSVFCGRLVADPSDGQDSLTPFPKSLSGAPNSATVRRRCSRSSGSFGGWIKCWTQPLPRSATHQVASNHAQYLAHRSADIARMRQSKPELAVAHADHGLKM
jgi:hypothetical protein